MKLHKLIVLTLFLTNYLIYSQTQNKSLLAIFAHPDDEQSIGPLLVKAVEEGRMVTLVIATDGRLGVNEYTDYTAGDGLAEVRREEMKCAASQLGVNLVHLNYHDQLKAAEGYDGHIPHVQSLVIEIEKIMTEIQPDAIITWGPDGATTHMDHRLVGASVTQAFLSKEWNKKVNLFYFGVPTDLLPSERDQILRGQKRKYLNTQIEFTLSQYDKAYEALKCHKSQYPLEVVEKIKQERAQLGTTLYLRQFIPPTSIRKTLFN